jgi:hypothetical protein
VKLCCIGFVRGYARRLEAEDLSSAEQEIQFAIEQAAVCIGADIGDDCARKHLREQIFESCIEGRNYCFEYHALPMSRSAFYERRRKFLYDIAEKLQIK